MYGSQRTLGPILKMEIPTARLRLRCYTGGDLASLVAGIGDWDVAQWLDQAPYPYSAKDGWAWIRHVEQRHRAEAPTTFALARSEDDVLVGGVGFHDYKGASELGFWLAKPYWGRGYASEAVQAVLAYGFETLEIDRIIARTDPANVRCQNVLAKAGFRRIADAQLDPPSRRGTTKHFNYELLLAHWRPNGA